MKADATRYLPDLPEDERRPVLELYCTVCRRDIDELAQALAKGEFPQVQKLAHRIKGSSNAIGEGVVARFAARLEKHPGNESHHLASQVLHCMREAFDGASDRISREP